MKNRTIKFVLAILVLVTTVFVSNINRSEAAAIQKIDVGCSATHAAVTLTVPARYLRITVSLASNLTTPLATKVVRVYGGVNSKHHITVHYPAQPSGTRLVVAVGECDGSKFMVPATLTGADCS